MAPLHKKDPEGDLNLENYPLIPTDTLLGSL